MRATRGPQHAATCRGTTSGLFVPSVTRLCSNRTVSDPADRYLIGQEVKVELLAAPYLAVVHFGVRNGHVACVGVDLRAFDSQPVDEEHLHVFRNDLLPDWEPLTARRLRDLRLEEVIEEARLRIGALIEEAIEYPGAKWEPKQLADLGETSRLLADGSASNRPGRPPSLSERDLVEVVADTYKRHVRAGGKTPVQAVRDALAAARSIPGAGKTNDDVTINQARAAVRRARAAGLIQQGSRKRKAD